MSDKTRAPYGTWPSPIDSATVVAKGTDLSRNFGQIHLDGGTAYWLEGRPHQNRNVVAMCTPADQSADAMPPPFSARTRAHEYGGGDFTVHRGVVYFVNERDQRIYRIDPQRRPRPITPPDDWRFADLVVDSSRNRLIAVREDYTQGGDPLAALVGLDAAGHSRPQVLDSGADFYSSPVVRPDGRALAWLCWRHPNMPWDATELWVAAIERDGSLSSPRCVAGGGEESIFQPQWSPGGFLYFVSDRSGWWNLERLVGDERQTVCPKSAEFGRPQWVFGESTYAFATEAKIVCSYAQEGTWHLATIDTQSGQLTDVRTPYTEISNLRATPKHVYFRGASPSSGYEIVRFDLDRRFPLAIRAGELPGIGEEFFSTPRSLTIDTNGNRCYALFYPPASGAYEGAEGEAPPLIVMSHGGPTASATTALDLRIQFWTSRGFAVLDVNYRGSSGYGRSFRRALDGQWGIADVEDCIAAARYVAQQGWADGSRMAIRGSSAGGFTTLCALTFHQDFRVGCSLYGISDLEALARDTHKFESHYTDRLVAPYPQSREIYRQRSPIHFVDRLSCPVILMQGLEDKVVPPSQAEAMRDALEAKGLPVRYVAFEGEGHGFRQPANAQRALDEELSFYQEHLLPVVVAERG